MLEAPKQVEAKYTQEQLEQMMPEYMVFMDKEDEEGGVAYLKEKFSERPVDILRFAGMVAMLIDDRKKDITADTGVDSNADAGITELERAEGSEGETPGSDDQLEPALRSGCDSGSDGGSDS